jgi:hypothetical protein
MPTISKSKGDGSLTHRTSMWQHVIESRLRTESCVFAGATVPQSTSVAMYPHYIFIKTTDLDSKTRKFPRSGFYVALDMHAGNADFLFEPVREAP